MFFRNRTCPGTSTNPTSRARRKRGEREPEVDREAALLLLREAIGIGAGEGEHERRLAVVDVARGRDYPHDTRERLQQEGVVVGIDRAQVAHEHALVDARDDVVLAQPGAERGRGRRRSTATPIDGMVNPGNDPPPATASVSTTSRPGSDPAIRSARARRSATGVVAIRHNGISVASPDR